MKNFRLFETEVEHNEAVIEECSVSYVIENDKLYTTPENNGEITFKILVEGDNWETGEKITFNDTLTLKAVKGMTWREFIDSGYNTLEFRYEDDSVRFEYKRKDFYYEACYDLLYNNSDFVQLDDFIIQNYEYPTYMPIFA